jgi:hypothetical protein
LSSYGANCTIFIVLFNQLLLERWEKYFPNSLIVKPFVPAQFSNNSLTSDFLDSIFYGLDDSCVAYRNPQENKKNSSLSLSSIKILDQLQKENIIVGAIKKDLIRHLLALQSCHIIDSNSYIPTLDEVKAYSSHFKESMRWVLRKYWNDNERSAWEGETFKWESNYVEYNDLSLSEHEKNIKKYLQLII